jgi:hypothetical protein
VLLAKTWQRLNTKSQWLTRLAALPYTKVDVPLTCAGVKVVVAEGEAIGGTYYLAGGVRIRLGAGSHAWMVTDDPAVGIPHRGGKRVGANLSSGGLHGDCPSGGLLLAVCKRTGRGNRARAAPSRRYHARIRGVAKAD